MDILEMASKLARTMYTNEFCSNCGRAITLDEAKTEVFSENNDNSTSRFVHKDCRMKQNPEKTWSFQGNPV